MSQYMLYSACILWCTTQVMLSNSPLTFEQQRELCTLAQLTNLPATTNLAALVTATQSRWLRPPNTERWEVTNPYTPETTEAIVACCRRLGMFTAVYPHKKSFQYLCVLGATLPAMQTRIQFAQVLWDLGIRWKEWVLLVGDRPLTETVDAIALVPQLPRNETEGASQLFHLLVKQMPAELQALPVHIVDTPQQVASDGSKRRPNTADTITRWFTENPSARDMSACFISHQPFILYQAATVDSICRNTTCETVGPEAFAKYLSQPHQLLDTIARWLYTKHQMASATETAAC